MKPLTAALAGSDRPPHQLAGYAVTAVRRCDCGVQQEQVYSAVPRNYGDRPETGSRSDDLTVRSMIDEAQRFAAEPGLAEGSLRIGVTSRLGNLRSWKRDADFLFVQRIRRHLPACRGR